MLLLHLITSSKHRSALAHNSYLAEAMEEDDDGIICMRNTSTTTSCVLVDLYCHEAPLVSTDPAAARGPHNGDGDRQKQDLLDEESLVLMMARQRCYAPSRGYISLLLSSPPSGDDLSLSCARSRGVHCIVYASGRLGLAAATGFNAVNYLDRFLSINCHIHRWETWMVELVSLACLSIACKLDEVNIPSIHHLQMEEVMSHSFRPATIRDMELALLKALQWRLACVTPFSFLQLLLPLITSCTVPPPAASRCTRLLIHSLSETSLLRFDPSVIASSALRCVLLQDHQQQADTSFITRPECPLHSFMWLKQDKDTTDACFNTMKALYAGLDCQQMQSDQQRSPISVIPFGIGTDDDNAVNRSAVSRRLFGRSTPQPTTEDEDRRSMPPTDTQKDKVLNSHI